MSSIKVGEILVKQGLLKAEQLAQAIEESKKSGNRVSSTILNLGYLKDDQILRAMEKHYGVPGLDVTKFKIEPAVTQLIPREICEKFLLIPVQKAGATLVVAFSDPSNIVVREDIRFLSKAKIQPVVATEAAITAAIDRFYSGNIKMLGIVDQSEDGDGASVVEVTESGGEENSPVVKFVNSILADSVRKRVSDIHFEPYERKFRVRFRIDGNLVEAAAPPSGLGPAIASRIKIMSKLDIAEKRRPQDGRLKIKTSQGREMDFRVSTLPTLWGEKVVMRLHVQA
jgi:type IV pilus assembly protein PilB